MSPTQVTPGGPNAPTVQEGPGAIPNQSLAAESIKHGGAFAENPDATAGKPPAADSSAKSGHHATGAAGQASYQAGEAPSSKAATTSHEKKAHEIKQHETKKHETRQQAQKSHQEKPSGHTGAKASHDAGHGETYAEAVASHKKEGGGASGIEEVMHTAPTYVSSSFVRDTGGPHGKNLKEGGFEGSGTGKGNLAEPGSLGDPGRVAEAHFAKINKEVGREAGPRQGKLDNEQPYGALGSEKEA